MPVENTGHAESTKIMIFGSSFMSQFLKEWNSASLVTIAAALSGK